ncbi:MAG: hypothetical protein KJZ78_17405 [Bryobacteraceae bacterium]|nr:hypothetical protein [Bryobacteraceae bacterium]
MAPDPLSPASAAHRDDSRGVEVRDGRGRQIARATSDQAQRVADAGAGRLVGGGRVLRVRDVAALRYLLSAEDSRTTARRGLGHDHISRRCEAYRGGAR